MSSFKTTINNTNQRLGTNFSTDLTVTKNGFIYGKTSPYTRFGKIKQGIGDIFKSKETKEKLKKLENEMQEHSLMPLKSNVDYDKWVKRGKELSKQYYKLTNRTYSSSNLGIDPRKTRAYVMQYNAKNPAQKNERGYFRYGSLTEATSKELGQAIKQNRAKLNNPNNYKIIIDRNDIFNH